MSASTDIISWLEKQTTYITAFEDGKSYVSYIHISRNRQVDIITKGIDKAGLYVFTKANDGVFEPQPAYLAQLAAIRIKAYAEHAQVNINRRAHTDSVRLDLAQEETRLEYETLVAKLFNLNPADVERYELDIKITEKTKPISRKLYVTSKVIEDCFNDKAEIFVAWVFRDARQIKLIDIGEMWDDEVISHDLQDILNYAANEKPHSGWSTPPELSASERERLAAGYFSQRRVKAFDEIIKEHNPKIKSNQPTKQAHGRTKRK